MTHFPMGILTEIKNVKIFRSSGKHGQQSLTQHPKPSDWLLFRPGCQARSRPLAIGGTHPIRGSYAWQEAPASPPITVHRGGPSARITAIVAPSTLAVLIWAALDHPSNVERTKGLVARAVFGLWDRARAGFRGGWRL